MIILAKDLVKKMLTADPKRRITADEILKHPWLVENSDSALMIGDKLRKYNARRKLKVGNPYSRKLELLLLSHQP